MILHLEDVDIVKFKKCYISALEFADKATEKCNKNSKKIFKNGGIAAKIVFKSDDEDFSDERILDFLKYHLSRFENIKKTPALTYIYNPLFIYASIRAEFINNFENLWTKALAPSNEDRFKSDEESKNTPGCATFELPPRFKVNMSK